MADQPTAPEQALEEQQKVTISADESKTASAQDESGKLAALIAAANLQYSLKNYESAAEIYSEATELAEGIHGDLSPRNAELLFLYGRCLFKVAVANNEVLGGKVAGEKKKDKAAKKVPQNGEAAEQKVAEKAAEAAAEVAKETEEKAQPESKPYFEFSGDPEWDTEEEEDAEDEDAQEPEAEEDEFGNAFEILEVARVLSERQMAGVKKAETGKGKNTAQDSEELRRAKERLADVHDYLAEIGMENGRFHDAIPDSRTALNYKVELYPEDSSIVAEAHFKLALALEYASVTEVQEAQQGEEQDAAPAAQNKQPEVDQGMRDEASDELQAAIKSCKLRITKEVDRRTDLKNSLQTAPSDSDRSRIQHEIDEVSKEINNVQSMVTELAQRVSLLEMLCPNRRLSLFQYKLHMVDISTQRTDIKNPLDISQGDVDLFPGDKNTLLTAMGELLATPAEKKTHLDKLAGDARDISNLARKKKPTAAPTVAAEGAATDGATKRKSEDPEAGSDGKRLKKEGDDTSSSSKQVKMEGISE